MTTKKRRISEALGVLKALGMPHEQLNDRTAICLLALLDLPADRKWSEAKNPMLGIRAILDFAREKLNTNYAENTRESVRKYSVNSSCLRVSCSTTQTSRTGQLTAPATVIRLRSMLSRSSGSTAQKLGMHRLKLTSRHAVRLPRNMRVRVTFIESL